MLRTAWGVSIPGTWGRGCKGSLVMVPTEGVLWIPKLERFPFQHLCQCCLTSFLSAAGESSLSGRHTCCLWWWEPAAWHSQLMQGACLTSRGWWHDAAGDVCLQHGIAPQPPWLLMSPPYGSLQTKTLARVPPVPMTGLLLLLLPLFLPLSTVSRLTRLTQWGLGDI